MAEYIEREAVIENIVQEALYYYYHDMNGESRGLMSAKELLQKAPSADVEPVTHAEWEYDGADRRCSNCGAIVEEDEWFNHNWYYCYHCGAKMEEYKSDIT